MHPQCFSRLQVANNQLAGELEPRGTLSTQMLQKKAAAAENSCAKRLLEPDRNLDTRCRTQKAVAMDHVFVSRRDFDRHNVARQLGCEGDLACRADRAVFGHEDRAAAGHSLDHPKQTST